MRLIYKGKEIKEGTLDNFITKDGETIHLLEKTTFSIKVKTIQNELFELEVNKSIDIEEFKSEIEKVSKIDKNSIRLVYKGKQLKDGPLDKFIKQDGETVHLIKGVSNTGQNPNDSQPQANIQQNANQNQTENQTGQTQNNQNQNPRQNMLNNLFGGTQPVFEITQSIRTNIGNLGPNGQPQAQNTNPQGNQNNAQNSQQNVGPQQGVNNPNITNARAANVRVDGVVSMNNNGITLNFPAIENQTLSENPVSYTLAHS